MSKIIGVHALASKVLVVATEGQVHDWAAYIDAVPGICHDKEYKLVASEGTKLPYKIARIIFPELDEEYTWRN